MKVLHFKPFSATRQASSIKSSKSVVPLASRHAPCQLLAGRLRAPDSRTARQVSSRSEPVHVCAAHQGPATEDGALTVPSRRSAVFTLLATTFCIPAGAAEALSIQEVERRLRDCFEKDQYYVSGNLDRGIFDPDCVFIDPTVKTKGTEKYASAVSSIFSPKSARADLIQCSVTGERTIELEWRLEGVITQLGKDFQFKPYTGKTTYTTDAVTGKIVSQFETWDISQLDVFLGLFSPNFGSPPAPSVEEIKRRRGIS